MKFLLEILKEMEGTTCSAVEIYNNAKAGIMFSRNMSNSVARNNIISNEVNGILVSYDNNISNSQYGINVVFSSSGNTFYSNVIKNSSHGRVTRFNSKQEYIL